MQPYALSTRDPYSTSCHYLVFKDQNKFIEINFPVKESLIFKINREFCQALFNALTKFSFPAMTVQIQPDVTV